MGLLGGTKILVASSVYNLAGDELEAPSFLKTTIANHVISGSNRSLSNILNSTYLSGPGVNLRNMYHWAVRNYPEIGLTEHRNKFSRPVSGAAVAAALPPEAGRTPEIRGISTDEADYIWWARQWILENHYERYNEEWEARMDSGSAGPVTIKFSNGDEFSFTPENYVVGHMYLYVTYRKVSDNRIHIYIYRYLTGNFELDYAVSITTVKQGDYYPVVPVRIHNQFIDEVDEYKARYARKALKKVTNGTLEELIDKLKENENLDDIDHAYVVFGVPLNTKVPEGKKYIYKFFQRALPVQNKDSEYYEEWEASQAAHEEEMQSWVDWYEAQGIIGDGLDDPGAPPVKGKPGPPRNLISVNVPDLEYETRISWSMMVETTGEGLAKADAKVGEVWWARLPDDTHTTYLPDALGQEGTITEKINHLYLFHQETADTWRRIEFKGLKHANDVYGGKAVEIDGNDALLDPELSGFIVPLRHEIIQDISLVESTQLASTSMLLVLNSYEEVKLKWYETGLFKIVLVVAVIAITAASGGFGAAGVGVLGANAAVGAALGLSGLAAVVAGVVANAIAAAVISSLIMKGATAVFGAKIGAIIGVVASMIAINGLTNMASTGQFALNFGQLTRAENIIKMTNSVAGGVAQGVAADTAEIVAQTEQLMKDYQEQSEEISKLYAENFGYGNGAIDTLALTDTEFGPFESPDTFLDRTLMTGSDIADLTMDLLSNFTDISLNTELPLQ